MPAAGRSGQADALVVGGGPGGCAAALALLRAGCSVLLLEQSTQPRYRPGEVLPPAARPLLAGLGLLKRFSAQRHLQAGTVRCRWGSPQAADVDLTFHPHGPGWHLDRAEFDEMLLDAVRAGGGQVIRGVTVRAARRAETGGLRMESTGSGWLPTTSAPVVVDATGRSRVVARALGVPRLGVDTLVGLVAIGRCPPPAGPVRVITLIEADEVGWWYAGRLPGGRVVAALLTDADLIPRGRVALAAFWRDRLGRTELASGEWAGVADPPAVRVVAAGTSRLAEPAGPGWVAVGDAAMTFDPLSGEGICAALRSGISGARAAEQMLSGTADAQREHVTDAARMFQDYLRLRAHYYTQGRRWDTEFWRRRTGHPRCADAAADELHGGR